jgi:hypothetical protein
MTRSRFSRRHQRKTLLLMMRPRIAVVWSSTLLIGPSFDKFRHRML